MADDVEPPTDSPRGALVPLLPAPVPAAPHDWQTIFHVSNQVVLYNPTSHALSIRQSSNFPPQIRRPCPYCKQPLPADFRPHPDLEDGDAGAVDAEDSFRASNYFHLLEISNETASRPSTPPTPPTPSGSQPRSTFPREAMAEGYFKAFFQEEYRLGMGANGSVFLCQHVLDGNPLGHFAVKKIAVGESHSYLLNILKEVRLLEQLHHPNIVTYHHAWLESCQFSSFGPKVPTLHVLMQWAEGGSLDDFIDVRLGRRSPHIHIHPASHLGVGGISLPQSSSSSGSGDSPIAVPPDTPTDGLSRAARIRAFREFQRAPEEQRQRIREEMARNTRLNGNNNQSHSQTWTAVHLLSADEVLSLFRDVVEGLAFLHAKSILHLDLKPGNVLLTWDEGKLIPRAMLSDFGTSRDMLQSARIRSGNTGTLEYTSPESLPSPRTGLLQPVDSKADMWSLGMILHKLLFFKSPYQHAADGEPLGSKGGEDDKMERLEREVLSYPGFKSTQTLGVQFDTRRLPRAFLVLLEGLLHVIPASRPSCERVVTAIREGKLDPLPPRSARRHGATDASETNSHSLIPAPRRPSNSPPPEEIVAASFEQQQTHAEVEPESEVEVEAELEKGNGITNSDAKPLLLGLPAPTPRAGVGHLTRIPLWIDETRIEWLGRSLILPRPAVLWTRSLKSGLVIVKVLSALSACPTGRPHWTAMAVVFLLAIVDTWFDGVWISVFLGALHLAVIRFGCWGRTCCL